jgi:hypothetical protein
MNDLESALREELRAEHYQLVTSTPLVDTVRRRVRRRRQMRYTVAAGATALLVAGVLGPIALRHAPGQQVGGSPAATAGDPLASGSTAPSATAAPARVGDLPVRGLPAYLAPVDPTTAVLADPALSVRPTGGQQSAFTRAARSGPVDRVVVVLDFTEPLGLVGTPVTLDWGGSSALGNLQTLVTDDPGSSTIYLIAWSPTGRRWFLAVTGTDADARRAVLQDVARQTLPGT